LRDQDGKVVAGLGFSMVLGSRDRANLEARFLAPLREAAARIEAILQAR
ncbi:MAG: IclR family transcriptional regulator, partial [Cupriavidus sp.]|nr:IclR family transcriptional regulator [Cupriavidus sp.]